LHQQNIVYTIFCLLSTFFLYFFLWVCYDVKQVFSIISKKGEFSMKKKTPNIVALVVAFAMLAVLLTACGGREDDADFHIGILQHFEHPALNAARDGFMNELEERGLSVRFTPFTAAGDLTTSAQMAEQLVGMNPDLLLGISTPSTRSLQAATSTTPIVFTAVTDPVAAEFVQTAERPGTNLTGMSDLLPIIEQIRFLQRLFPNAETVGIIYNSGEENSVIQANMAADAMRELGLTYIRATVTGTHDVAQITESIVRQVDVIFTPTCNTMAEAMTTAVMSAADAGIAIVAGDSGSVVRGALATEGIDYYLLGRQAAAMAAQILLGEAVPQEMSVLWQDTREITINMATARHLGIEIPADILATATLVEE